MTPLAARLVRRIRADGPMRGADVMAACLLDPEHGYYATREPFGTAGDFVTAPEISQMFGELLGLALAQAWIDQGAPARVVLAELGPGRGTLMADVLRAARAVPGFAAAAEVHLVEASARLRAVQAERLGGAARWHDTVEGLPEAPLFLLANEFFDALPVRQFVRHPAGWAERMVGVADDALVWGLSPPAPLAALDHRLDDTAPGEVVEVCPAAPGIMAAVAGRIARHGGAALVIDYGDWRSRGDTLQALWRGAPDPALAHPGAADLTAHVDFEPLAIAARAAGAATAGPVPQGQFLRRLGIDARAARLARSLTGAALESHRAAHRRLTDAAEMGTLFKVLAVYPPTRSAPPGYEV
ncbi:class I SAM-dependent methyltransferase [Rhodobaculum claviforme]|uniref:Methyltransferase n=1 Tax=Rhodobaculum claviforme TaxID=1549854 RepID=A0A934WJI1_9RHOB|nr:SAM-dependent methyltransferase [Rhodobaculum claviforme]MBK5928081.1 methyltransferase [Rhodobaculum claviforme]